MRRLIILILANFFPEIAHAAGNVEGLNGSYTAGLTHTLFGLDHLIAMIAVGLLSAQIGSRAVIQVPLIFVASLIIGGAVGLTLGESETREWLLSTSEIVIMTSDILLVLAIIWITPRGGNFSALSLIGLFVIVFGLFHGFAHGGEIPTGAIALWYVAGFATTSAVMHILGVAIGEIGRVFPQPRVARGIFASILLGISIPYQVDFWNSAMPVFMLEIFGL